MEKGIAIPHAQDASINTAAMYEVRLENSISWKTFDQKPVDTVIAFLIPEHGSQNHLKYLSEVSKLLMHQKFVDNLKSKTSVNEIYQLFTK